MPGFEASIEGLGELKERLSKMAGPEAKKILDRGLLAGARVFNGALFEAAPVRTDTISGTALPPGALKSDIAIRRTPVSDGETSIFKVGPGKRTQYAARLTEYGHRQVRNTSQAVGTAGKGRNREKNGGTVVKMVPPHPFVRGTFESQQSAANEAMLDSVREDMAKLNGGASGVDQPEEVSAQE